MTRSNVLIYLTCVCLFVSCAKKDEPIRILLNKIGDSTSPDYYLIIPVKACSSCVEEILSFVRANVGNPKITFVLTCNEGKLLNLLLSIEERKSVNILLDKQGLFEKSGIVIETSLLLKAGDGQFEEQKILNAVNLTSELATLHHLIH